MKNHISYIIEMALIWRLRITFLFDIDNEKCFFFKLKRDNYSILSLCMFEKLFDKPGKTAKIRNADNGFISCSGACKL